MESTGLSPLLAARPAPLYRLALVAVAVVMAVLPVVYVALTVLTLWGAYHFATHYFMSIWEVPGFSGSAVLIKILFSCAPPIIGVTVAVFMVKPLFGRSRARTQPPVLTEQDAPQVYALVAKVCHAVGARPPHRIELSCLLNASASLEGGLRALFDNRQVLTLGLPLVAGLTQRELAGVIAHEFKHFRQGSGMRVTYLIRLVDAWFVRAVYGRDRWDAALAWIAARVPGRLMSILMIWVAFGIMFSRGVLWLLMMVGRGFGAGLSRQMEYDADRAEVAVAGSEAFASTSIKLVVLGAVFEDITLHLRQSWRTKSQLPDNLPLFLDHRMRCLASDRRARLKNKAESSKTGLFDSHPCMADRVRRARRLAERGQEFSEAPARELFGNFEELSRLVTRALYGEQLNVPVRPEFLVPLEKVLEVEAAELAAALAARRQRKPAPRAIGGRASSGS